jgi:hypothetical protein
MRRMPEVFLASSPGVRFEKLSLTATSIKEVSRLKRLHNKTIHPTTLPNRPLDLPLQHLAPRAFTFNILITQQSIL